MKKIFAFVLFATFTIVSCSKDDSDKKDNGPIVLKKMIETYEDGSSVTIQYTYDSDKITTVTYSNGFVENYYYAPDGNISKIEKLKNGVIAEEENFTSTSSVFLGRYEKKIIEDSYVFTEGFGYRNIHTPMPDDQEYISSGSVLNNAEGKKSYNTKYIMNGDNIFQKVDDYGYNKVLIATYQYDSKNNPFRNVHNNEFFILAKKRSGINNIIGINFNGPGLNENMSAKYTYNSDNFPVTSEETNEKGKKIKREYFY